MNEIPYPVAEVSKRPTGRADPFSPVPVPRQAWVKGPLLMGSVAEPRTPPSSYPQLQSHSALAAPRKSDVVRSPRTALPSTSERLDYPAKAQQVGTGLVGDARVTPALAGVLLGVITALAFQSNMDSYAAAAVGLYATGFLTGALGGWCLTTYVNAKVSRLQQTADATLAGLRLTSD